VRMNPSLKVEEILGGSSLVVRVSGGTELKLKFETMGGLRRVDDW